VIGKAVATVGRCEANVRAFLSRHVARMIFDKFHFGLPNCHNIGDGQTFPLQPQTFTRRIRLDQTVLFVEPIQDVGKGSDRYDLVYISVRNRFSVKWKEFDVESTLLRLSARARLPVSTVNIHIHNLSLMDEKDSICDGIERESSNIFQASDEHSHVAAIEFGTNHRLLAARIGPEEQSQHRMDGNAARLLSVARVDSAQTLHGIDAGQIAKFKFDQR
jgi:hypothetical protein